METFILTYCDPDSYLSHTTVYGVFASQEAAVNYLEKRERYVVGYRIDHWKDDRCLESTDVRTIWKK